MATPPWPSPSGGLEVVDLGIVPDRLPETVGAVRRARDVGADILVTSGGASVGDYDLVQKALAAEGLALSFWKVALRPGRPMMHGRLGAMHVLGLPGNPVSSCVCAVLFLVPLMRRLAGRSDVEPALDIARLGCDLPANDERADYLRATLAPGPDGMPVATPAPVQDSSMLTRLARADCLLIRDSRARGQGGRAMFHHNACILTASASTFVWTKAAAAAAPRLRRETADIDA